MKKVLPFNDALNYLNELGYPIGKSTLYKLTADRAIPFKRFGQRKIVFNSEELEVWAESKLTDVNQGVIDITNRVATAARRKIK